MTLLKTFYYPDVTKYNCQSHGKIIFLKTQPSCFNYLDNLMTIDHLGQLHHHSSLRYSSQQCQ